ncbi:MAG TPA: hypothetical protein VJW55_05045 [Candidatus Angelobacter sp.]|nr:hypothetical protein [Candidatus Angelobacter sp.]
MGQCEWRLGTLFAGGFRSGREQSSACIRRRNDFKTGIPLLGIRAEVRDFLTGSPGFGFPSSIFTINGNFNHHNVLAGAGIVLRF